MKSDDTTAARLLPPAPRGVDPVSTLAWIYQSGAYAAGLAGEAAETAGSALADPLRSVQATAESVERTTTIVAVGGVALVGGLVAWRVLR